MDFSIRTKAEEGKPLRLNRIVMKELRVAKLFSENKIRINHADYDVGGERLITSGDNDQLAIYDCIKGE